MSMDAAQAVTAGCFDQLSFARSVLRSEAEAIAALARDVPPAFGDAVTRILNASGAVVVSGMGKAGLIGRKVSASFSSTGTPSHFLHPAEAIHGDLGSVREGDIVLMLSFSGETEEVVRILPTLRRSGAAIVAITGRPASQLAAQADLVLPLGELREACHLGLAPSTSTAAMLALGDALALTVSRQRGFEATDFARFHPGGSLGRRLARVDDQMRPLSECRVASDQLSVREVLARETQTGRRSGVILLQNEQLALSGVFTDSDLARLLANQDWDRLEQPMAAVMTTSPKTVPSGVLLDEAIQLLETYRISELPVVDGDHRPLGLIDITDVIGLSGKSTRSNDTSDRTGTVKATPSTPANETETSTPITLPIQRDTRAS